MYIVKKQQTCPGPAYSDMRPCKTDKLILINIVPQRKLMIGKLESLQQLWGQHSYSPLLEVSSQTGQIAASLVIMIYQDIIDGDERRR